MRGRTTAPENLFLRGCCRFDDSVFYGGDLLRGAHRTACLSRDGILATQLQRSGNRHHRRPQSPRPDRSPTPVRTRARRAEERARQGREAERSASRLIQSPHVWRTVQRLVSRTGLFRAPSQRNRPSAIRVQQSHFACDQWRRPRRTPRRAPPANAAATLANGCSVTVSSALCAASRPNSALRSAA